MGILICQNLDWKIDWNSNLSKFQVNVCLECMNASLKTLKRRFIRCSAQATITHMKKFIAKKVLSGMEKYRDVSIFDIVGEYCYYYFH